MEQGGAATVTEMAPIGEIKGASVKQFRVDSGAGLQIVVCEYGATLVSIKSRSSESSEMEELTLCRQSLHDLMTRDINPYYGASCGRTAGRIANAKFSLNGQDYHLKANNGPNSLHGGENGFDQKVWSSQIVTNCSLSDITGEEAQDIRVSGVVFTCQSAHMEEGYPAELEVKSSYLMSKCNRLFMVWSARNLSSDIETPLNLCNHAYWNLSGDFKQKKIDDHTLYLNCDKYLPMGDYQIPTGDIVEVDGSPFDFRGEESRLGGLDRLSGAVDGGGKPGIDHAFVVSKTGTGRLQRAALLKDAKSGRELEILTTHPAMVVYTSNWLPGGVEDPADTHRVHAAVCLETCQFPDSINQGGKPGWPDKSDYVLGAGKTMTHYSEHIFRF